MELEKFDSVAIPNFSFPPNPNFYYFYKFLGHGVLVYERGRFTFYTTKFDYQGRGKIINSYKEIKTKYSDNFCGKNIHNELEKMREIKSEREIANIRKTCRDALRIFKHLKIFDRTEMEVAKQFELLAARAGYYESFPTIVSTKPHVHHINTDHAIGRDETVLIDFGLWNGYSSDMTRMFNPPSELERVVSDVFEYAYDHAKPGVKISEFCAGVRKVMGSYSKYFPHALGHGVGIAVHELPNVSIKSKERFKEGMVFTIEPGVYMRKKFIRVEDVFVMRHDGIEKLS